MCHKNWKTYLAVGAGVLILFLALGINPGYLLGFAICPLMMFFMMRGMGGMSSGRPSHPHDEDEASPQRP
jgi:L-asparagine transporter-like permease